jgi:hypothetical protein
VVGVDPQAVPVHGRLFREVVAEVDGDAVADLAEEHRPRDAAGSRLGVSVVVGPHVRGLAGEERPLRRGGDDAHLDRVGIRIDIDEGHGAERRDERRHLRLTAATGDDERSHEEGFQSVSFHGFIHLRRVSDT